MPAPSCVCATVAPTSSSGRRTPIISNGCKADAGCLIESLAIRQTPRGCKRYAAPRHIGAPTSSGAPPVDVRAEDAVGDEVAHHLERAAADREHARVAHHPFERQRAAVAGRAVDLQRLARHLLIHGADRKSTRLNSSHVAISYAVFCLKKKKTIN